MVRNGELDFARGKALLAAEVPLLFSASRIAVGAGPIKASLTADGVELSNFLPLLPKGTQMAGRIDGSIVAGGTFDAPQIDGSFALRDGTFVGRWRSRRSPASVPNWLCAKTARRCKGAQRSAVAHSLRKARGRLRTSENRPARLLTSRLVRQTCASTYPTILRANSMPASPSNAVAQPRRW